MLTVQPGFKRDMRILGGAMFCHTWVEDFAKEHSYHSKTWVFTAETARQIDDAPCVLGVVQGHADGAPNSAGGL